jgi:hypothetical protein
MSTKENHQNKRFDYQAELQDIGQQYHASNEDNEDKITARVAKVHRPLNKEVQCDCPGSEPGIVKSDPMAHVPGCQFRKNSLSDILLTLL